MAFTFFCALLMTVTFGQKLGPCDIYDNEGTPCVAAHSTVRALYHAYTGPLYQVRRSSDNATRDIGTISIGGFADSAAQDKFCMGSKCMIYLIYDQSSLRNHLGLAPGGGSVQTPDTGVSADKLKTSVNGYAVYGAYFEKGMGYRNDNTSGIPIGDNSESLYMVVGGRHYNSGCCFDYGNAETDNYDHGEGTMEAIYFGSWNASRNGWSGGVGGGPWVMADLENGLWAGNETPYNTQNTPMDAEYVTAMLKGAANRWALKGGDAQVGTLKKLYEGPRPAGYIKMKKEGAIVLGIGGDNSNAAVGTFFEGAIAKGYASDKADDLVQANVVAVSYGEAAQPELLFL